MTAALAQPPTAGGRTGARSSKRSAPRLIPVPDCEPPLDPLRQANLFAAAQRGPFRTREPLRVTLPQARIASGANSGLPMQLLTLVPPVDVPHRAQPDRALEPRMTHHRWDLPAVATRRLVALAAVATAAPDEHPTTSQSRSPRTGVRRIFSTSGSVPRREPALADELLLVRKLPQNPPREQAESAGASLARAVLEVLAGRRPLAQLRHHCVTEVFDGLGDFPMLSGTARLLSLWACEPSLDTAEISAAFHCGALTRALALRLQCHRNQWLITAIQLA